jgi:hypothetical protein
MSSSEAADHAVADELERLFDAMASGTGPAPDPQSLTRILSTAVRLYATVNEGRDEAVAPLEDATSTTDAVIVATALLKARDLNPFDLALWFSRDRVAG